MRRRAGAQVAMMLIPCSRAQEQDHENNEALFGGRKNKNGKQPFHLLAYKIGSSNPAP
jgi:hypothetical protein